MKSPQRSFGPRFPCLALAGQQDLSIPIAIEDFDKTIASVLRSTLLGMKHVAPIMMGEAPAAA
jgi:hypothetical protein